MPAFLIAGLLAGGAAAGAAALTASASAIAAGAIGSAFLTAFATTTILTGISQALTKTPGQAGTPAAGSGVVGNQARTTSVRQAISERQVIVGRCRVGGTITYMEVVGSDLHLVITWAGHVCQAVDEIWFDNAPMVVAGNGDIVGGHFGVTQYMDALATTSSSPYTVTLKHTPDFTNGLSSFTAYWSDGVSYYPPLLTNVSPAAPSGPTEYSQSGTTVTFWQAGNYVIYYDASAADAPPPSGHTAWASVEHSLGDEAGQPFSSLVTASAGKWTDAHRQTGCCKSHIRLSSNPYAFPTGIPNITAVVRGAKIYDTRVSASAWTNNPALWVSNYLTNTDYGLAADQTTEIDATDLNAAANLCEERVSLATATDTFTADATADTLTLAGKRIPDIGDGVRVSSGGTLPSPLAAATTYYAIRGTNGILQLATSYANAMAGTAINITTAGSGTHTLTFYDEQRYKANGAFLVSETPRDVMTRLLAAMSGRAVPAGEKWHIFGGAHETPTVTIAEDDIVGPTKTQPIVSRRDSCNAVKGLFTDPASAWQPTDFPCYPLPGSGYDTYIALDNGERVWRDVDYTAFVTSGTQAQRLAKIELLRTRYATSEIVPCKLTAYAAMTGRTVARNDTQLGWSSEPFEVVQSQFTVDAAGALGVELTLRRINSGIYAWTTAEEQALVVAGIPALPDRYPQL